MLGGFLKCEAKQGLFQWRKLPRLTRDGAIVAANCDLFPFSPHDGQFGAVEQKFYTTLSQNGNKSNHTQKNGVTVYFPLTGQSGWISCLIIFFAPNICRTGMGFFSGVKCHGKLLELFS